MDSERSQMGWIRLSAALVLTVVLGGHRLAASAPGAGEPAEGEPTAKGRVETDSPEEKTAGNRRYRNERASFSFEIPPGWERIANPIVADRRVALKDRYGLDLIPPCEAAFQRVDRDGWFVYPYFFVQVIERRRMGRRAISSFLSDVEARLADGPGEAHGPLAAALEVVHLLTVDERRGNARCEIEAALEGERVRIVYHFLFCRAGIVCFYFYGMSEAVETEAALFESVIRSVDFDEGHGYADSEGWADRLPASLTTPWGTAAIVLLLVFLVFLVRLVSNRGERKREAVRQEMAEMDARVDELRRRRRERLR